jgi:predicted amidophosphoribosyltransferase
MHTDDQPDVMDLRDEPQPCEICGNDASETPCDTGRFCDDCHADLNISGCRSDDCWAYEFNDYES